MIDVVAYDPRWAATFASLRIRYQAALESVPVVAIEHVGSTSVEGLAAKPVIDVDIVVAPEHVRDAIAAMERLGFRSLGERGIAQRWALQPPTGYPRTNTYVIVEGCTALRNHLGVREVLRSDATLRDEYGALKQSLAVHLDDPDRYVAAKSALLSVILARAGLSEDERADIEHANRAT